MRVSIGDSNKRFEAKIVGRDPGTDLAVLKIDAANLSPASFGDSDQLEVGDVVLAIGNPFGVGQTVTSGIVSALGRSHLGINTFENFIQTDAAINPGNSGGPLLDSAGRLIGVNTAIYSPSGASAGIGFAVPVETPGLTVGGREKTLGLRGASITRLYLRDCRVPADRLLGAEGDGYKIALGALDYGRVGIAAARHVQRLAGAQCHDAHPDAAGLREGRQQVAVQRRVQHLDVRAAPFDLVLGEPGGDEVAEGGGVGY